VNRRSLQQVGLYGAALVLALSVFFANGQPLFYFDTGSYLDQGAKLLGLAPPPVATPAPDVDETAAPQPAVNSPPDEPSADATVVGSRSVAYGLMLAVIVALAGLPGVVAVNLSIIWCATWLFARRLAASGPAVLPPGQLAAVGLLAASLGSLPFYVAFAMPDILAPALILMIAVLFVHAGAMTRTERVLAILLALFAIVAHISHLLVVVLLIPVAVLASPAAAGRRIPVVLALAGLLAGAGLAERYVFGMAVERYLHKRVVYLPFVTARLIDDGPGLRFLEQRCPDPAYATCALFAALSASDNPQRLDAPNILFAQSPQRASYRTLPDAEMTAVAGDQIAFGLDVVSHDPLGVAAAILRNVAVQLGYFSVEMTIPSPDMLATTGTFTDRLPPSIGNGRLIAARPVWVPALMVGHGIVYVGSLAVLGWLALRGRLSRADRAMVIIVLAGIVANAIVCGAVSEPAHRYGARVMFLLPLMAALFGVARGSGSRGSAMRSVSYSRPGPR
jgi:hypothetical protein